MKVRIELRCTNEFSYTENCPNDLPHLQKIDGDQTVDVNIDGG